MDPPPPGLTSQTARHHWTSHQLLPLTLMRASHVHADNSIVYSWCMCVCVCVCVCVFNILGVVVTLTCCVPERLFDTELAHTETMSLQSNAPLLLLPVGIGHRQQCNWCK